MINSGRAGGEVGPGGPLPGSCVRAEDTEAEMWRVEDGWGMGSQSNGGWVEDSLAAVKCKGRGEGRDKSKNDSRGSVKLLKALPFPGRQFVLHAAESTSWETEHHLERAPRSWGGGGG